MEPVFILTLGFDPATFERLDALRRAHFPPERNFIPAHLTLFHSLNRDAEPAIRAAAERPPIALAFSRVHPLGRGAALAVESPELLALQATLARAFEGRLTAQDRQPYRPHVTIQNKAEPEIARETFEALSAEFSPWEGTGVVLLFWRYLGGPWGLEAEFPFGGSMSTSTQRAEAR